MNIRGILAWLEETLGRRTAGWILLLLLLAAYTAAYLNHPLFPGGAAVESRTGWWSWFDQFAYWRSATALAHLQVTSGDYYYPLGYPLLGALFWHFMPAHAFFVPNAVSVSLTAVVWWKFARRGLSRVQVLGLAVLFIALHRDLLALTLVIPWNTVVTQLTLLAGMWLMVTTAGWRSVWWLAGLAAATCLVRPGDAASFAPMLVWSVVRLPGWRDRLTAAAAGLGLVGAVVVAVGALNVATFGAWSTPYERITGEIGFFGFPPLMKLHWLFVDGRPFFGEENTALLFRYPWLFLALPGAVFWVRRDGAAAVAALLALGLNWGLYVSYNDLMPSGLFRFSQIHYLSWAFLPLWALAAAAVLRGWPERAVRAGWVLAGIALVAALGLQLRERGRDTRISSGRLENLPQDGPWWLRLPGVPVEAASRVSLDGRLVSEPADYFVPYVPSDLRMLFPAQREGATLTLPAEAEGRASPQVGDFIWAWQFEPCRLNPRRD